VGVGAEGGITLDDFGQPLRSAHFLPLYWAFCTLSSHAM
jgi:hypothetical protein